MWSYQTVQCDCATIDALKCSNKFGLNFIADRLRSRLVVFTKRIKAMARNSSSNNRTFMSIIRLPIGGHKVGRNCGQPNSSFEIVNDSCKRRRQSAFLFGVHERQIDCSKWRPIAYYLGNNFQWFPVNSSYCSRLELQAKPCSQI